MANQAAKKRKEENRKHMTNLLRLIIASNVIYVLVRMLVFHSTFTWKHWVGLLITSIAYGLSFKQLESMAKPTYTDDGELLDGGYDMSTGGICGYLHDVIYLTSFVQIMSILSGKFWWTYLVWCPSSFHYVVRVLQSIYNFYVHLTLVPAMLLGIPAFGVYKVSGLLKGALLGGSEGEAEDEKSRKKREKMERKASRGKFIKTRNR